MMDRLSAVQKCVFAIILAGMVMLVTIPLMFFITVSFSNATEMTQFVRNQILTQSAVAMLGQANSLPQMAMQLIGG